MNILHFIHIKNKLYQIPVSRFFGKLHSERVYHQTGPGEIVVTHLCGNVSRQIHLINNQIFMALSPIFIPFIG